MSDKVPSIKVDAAFRKMCKFLSKRISGDSVRKACKACGIKDIRYQSRVVKRLKELSEGKVHRRQGRNLKYTEDIMERAHDICRQNANMNASDVLQQLVAEGRLIAKSKTDVFWQRFKAWCKGRGQRASISRSKPVFAISSDNAKRRVEWCSHLLAKIKADKAFMERVWFGDETTQLARPHPKGNG